MQRKSLAFLFVWHFASQLYTFELTLLFCSILACQKIAVENIEMKTQRDFIDHPSDHVVCSMTHITTLMTSDSLMTHNALKSENKCNLGR